MQFCGVFSTPQVPQQQSQPQDPNAGCVAVVAVVAVWDRIAVAVKVKLRRKIPTLGVSHVSHLY